MKMEKEENNIGIIATVIIIVILLIWLGEVFLSLNPEWICNNTITEQPTNDIFNALNTLFSGLAFAGLIITILLQRNELKLQRLELSQTREELKKTSEANQEIAKENKEKAILDLYLTYSSKEFQPRIGSTWKVLKCCVLSKDYCDYFVSRLFPVEQIEFSEKIANEIKGEITNKDNDSRLEEIELIDRKNRHEFDRFLNFLNVLANKKGSQEIIKKFDFYYDWWRPMLWLVIWHRENKMKSGHLIKKYSFSPNYLDTLIKMDKAYDLIPLDSEEAMWNYFNTHPRMISIGIDDKYRILYEKYDS